MLEYIRLGGIVMYPLLMISIINLSLVLFIGVNLFLFRFRLRNQPFKSSIFGDMESSDWEKIFFHYEKNIQWLSNLSGLATMLGLLGTVIGIYQAFESMNIKGQVSIEIFASGISTALITTIFGLSIAIPSTLFYYLFRNQLDYIEINLCNFKNDSKN